MLITGASIGVGEVLACCPAPAPAPEGAKIILISEKDTQDQLKRALLAWLCDILSSHTELATQASDWELEGSRN